MQGMHITGDLIADYGKVPQGGVHYGLLRCWVAGQHET
jgi:hypothetical protein